MSPAQGLQGRAGAIRIDFGQETQMAEIDPEDRNILFHHAAGHAKESPVAAKGNRHVYGRRPPCPRIRPERPGPFRRQLDGNPVVRAFPQDGRQGVLHFVDLHVGEQPQTQLFHTSIPSRIQRGMGPGDEGIDILRRDAVRKPLLRR